MSDDARRNRSVARGGMINILGNVVGLIEPLFMMTVSWLLGADVLGSYVLAITYAAMLLKLVCMGLDKGLLRHVPLARAADDDGEQLASVLGTTLRWMMALSLVGTLLVYLGADLIVASGGDDKSGDASWWLTLIVLGVPGETLSYYYVYALRGARRMGPFVLVRQFLRPALLLAITVPAILLGAGKLSPVIGYIAAQYITAAVAHVQFRRYFRDQSLLRIIRARNDGDLIRFSLPQGLTEFLNYLLGRTDIIMVSFFFPDRPELLAVYAVASLLAGVVRKVRIGFATSVAPVLSEQMAREQTAELKGTYRKASRWIALLYFLVAGVVVLAAPLFLRAFGPDFSDYWLLVPILVGGRLFNSVGGPAQIGLLMAGRSKLELVNNVLTNALNIGLNLLLIPTFHIYGAATATAVSMTLFNAARVTQLAILVRIWPSPADVLKVMLAAAVSLGAGVALLLLSRGMWLHTVAAVLFVLLYPTALWVLGLRDDMKGLVNHFRRKPART